MNPWKYIQECVLSIKMNFKASTYDSVLWIVDVVPKLAGFSLHKPKLSTFEPYFVIQFSMLAYVYGAGCSVYVFKYAENATDQIKGYVNIAIFFQVLSMSVWFRNERSLLRAVLDNSKLNDELAQISATTVRAKHQKMMSVTKYILITFYSVNYLNAVTSYIPRRATLTHEFAMHPCPGLDLTSSFNRVACTTLLAVQELAVMTTALNYQALILFLISHTATMYHLLSEDVMTLNTADTTEVKNKLPSFIKRHVLTIDTVTKLKALYTSPLGVNFGSNAVCIAFFFYMSLEEMITFLSIMMYCFLVFFLYCFSCQKLINAAEVFEIAVYSCGWENFEKSEMKMVYIMLMLAQQKVELLAADIIPVNIYTFAVTLQSMFKFVTVMKF